MRKFMDSPQPTEMYHQSTRSLKEKPHTQLTDGNQDSLLPKKIRTTSVRKAWMKKFMDSLQLIEMSHQLIKSLKEKLHIQQTDLNLVGLFHRKIKTISVKRAWMKKYMALLLLIGMFHQSIRLSRGKLHTQLMVGNPDSLFLRKTRMISARKAWTRRSTDSHPLIEMFHQLTKL